LKINVIDNRGLIIDTFDSEVEPKVGQLATLTSGAQFIVAKVRKNVNKNLLEVFVDIPLKAQKYPLNTSNLLGGK
jgi:hypothetical protein